MKNKSLLTLVLLAFGSGLFATTTANKPILKAPTNVSINDVSINEGSSGTFTNLIFSVTRDNTSEAFTLTVNTNDGSATVADNDYIAISGGTVTFTVGGNLTETVTVLITRDTKVEANETFTVLLSGASGMVTITDGTGIGTINNDEVDWGDGPDSLPTISFYNGARHNTVFGFQLGAAIDGDPDGQLTGGTHSNLANGDDIDADGDDEDGVTLPSIFLTGATATVTVNASQAGKLDAFMDFNWNRQLGDAGEKIFNNVALAAGDNVLTFNVPGGAVVGSSFMRFRFSSAGGLSHSGLATDGEVEDYRVQIVNNQFSIDNPSVVEGDAATTTLIYTISQTNNSMASSVNYAITGGTATSGTDYVPLAAGTINFAAGGPLSQTITVTVNGDLVVENNETIIITLSNPVKGGIGANNPGIGSITNNDNATITLSGGVSQNEGTSFVFTATLDNQVQGGFSVPFTTNNGTATTTDSDYTDNDGTLTFSGAPESQTITVVSTTDNKVELDETFTVALGAISGAPAGVTIAGSPQTGTIQNNDAATVSIAANVSQSEATTPQAFSVTLSNPVDVPVTVNFSTTDGTATTADNDYTGIASQTVTFPAGSNTAQPVNVSITNDNKVETDEVYNVAIGTLNASGRNVTLGTTSRTGTITNNDAAVVTLSGGGAANEGNTGTTARQCTLTLNNPVQGGFTLPYTTNDGTATIADNDYQDNDGSFTFAGTAGETKTITVLVNGDSKVEANETFTVALGAITGAPAGVTTAGSPQTATITNDEVDFGDVFDIGAPFFSTNLANNGARHSTVLGMHLGAAIDGDSDGQGDFTATGDDTDADGDDEDGVVLPVLVKGATANVSVTASAPGFLDAWVDFEANASWDDSSNKIFTSFPLLAGVNNISFNVPVAASATTGAFARFRFSSTGGLSHTGAAADGEVEDYMTSIIDNLFSIDNPSVAEGNASTANLVFTVSRSSSAIASSVDYAITGGTATSGTDYVPLAAGTINFAAGGALSQTITVTVNGDLVVENNETIIITLSNPVGGGIGAANPGTGTITNNDAALVTLSGGVSQNEGTSFVFTATLNNPVQGGFSVPYTTNNGTATTTDNDYTDNDGTLTFSGTPESQTITVVSTTDNKVELDETFTVALGAISGAPAGVTTAGSPQTGTIANDDAATVSLAANVSQIESTIPQVFSVTLTNPVDVAVTVQFSTSDGTATTADNDYTGIGSQAVTFPAGSITSQSVNVSITIDNKVETDEVYNVAIGTLNASGRNVMLGTTSRTGTITNDDAAVVTLSGGGAANEGNTGTNPRVFTATLNNPVQGGFTLPYTTNDGTATTADNDYLDNDGPALIFAGTAGEAKTITVLVNGDSKVEANETFTVALGAITGAPAGVSTAGSPQTGTITNDEVDWGDGPDSLPTISFYNGARHNTVLGFQLGAAIDGDPDGQLTGGTHSNLANGDDTDADGDDEDGVTLPGVFVRGTTATITVNAAQAGKLDAFMDFNWNRQLGDAGEKIFNNVALAAGDNVLTFNVPAGAVVGSSFMRFRFSSVGGLSHSGPATDGEVEDYRVQIVSNQFSINNPSVAEGNAGPTNLVYTVSRTSNAVASSVDYAITGGTATSGTDYQPLAAGTINFTAGGPMDQTITVTVNGDLVVENNETVIITLSNPVGGGIGAANPGTGTITNDDAATLTLSGGIAQNESNAVTVNYTFTATLSAAVQDGFTVPYTTNNGTATTADGDYTDNDGNLVFAGNIGETKTFTVSANGDTKVELSETFTAALGTLTGTSAVQIAAISLSGSPQTATITNDDAATVTLAANVSQVEALSPQTFSVTLSNPVDVPVTVQFNTNDGTATTLDNDYTGIVNQTVTFPANTTTAQSVNVAIVNDAKVEANETYTGTIGSLAASGRNVVLGTATRTGTIQNDDATNLFIAGPVTHPEGNAGTTNYLFSISITAPVQGGFTVNYTTNDGSATTANIDYVDNDGTLTYTGINFNETKTVTVQGVGDLNIENDEIFTLLLGAITAATPEQTAAITITGNNPETGTIVNDELDWADAPSAAQSGFAGTYPTLAVNNGARHALAPGGLRLGATVDADLNGQPNANATGDGADEDGVTLPGVIVLNTNANITVNASAAGLLNAWVDFNRDGDWEDDGEQIFINQSVVAGSNALSFAVPNGSVGTSFMRFRLATTAGASFDGLAADGEVEDYAINIVNTQFSISDPTVAEGNAGTSNLGFVISRTVNANACSVDFAITGGTATTADNDYQILAAGTVNFTAGGAFSQTINVLVNGDLKVELNETVDMTLSNPVNGSILDGSGTGTITNDDAATITITNPTVTEGDVPNTVTATFTINMSNPSDANVSLNYMTLDGSATTANNDYVSANGSHTFTPGQTSKTVSVTVNGDCGIEANETYLLRLSGLANNGRNVSLSGGGATLDGTGTITNDDALPVITCPASIVRNVDPGVCTTSVTLPLPTTSSVCGSSSLEFRFRTVDASNVPTGPYNAYAPSSSNTVIFSRGRYEVEWRITDGSGSSVCSFFLQVNDTQAPIITCPVNQNISASAFCSGTVGTWNPATLSDNCTATGLITVTQTPPASTVLSGHNDSELVTLTANDGNGNTSSCSFTVTLKDLTLPTALCKNVTANLGANGTVTVAPALVNNGSSDNCTFTLTLTPNTFNCLNIGMNAVVLRATDAAGNSSTCSAKVMVKDASGPVAKCKNPTIFLDNLGQATLTVAQVNNGSTDNCGIATMSISETQFNCSNLPGSAWPVTLNLTDVNGNSSSCLSYVTVKETIAPTAICEDVTVQLNASGNAVVYGADLAAASIDNCSVWSYSPIAKVYKVFNIGNNNLTITVKDWSGNASTCVSVVTVLPFNGLDPNPSDFSDRLEETDLAFNVYPNPTSGDAAIAFELPTEQAVSIRVYDLQGRMVLNREDQGFEGINTLELRLEGIPPGLYLVDFQSADLKALRRLVVQE